MESHRRSCSSSRTYVVLLRTLWVLVAVLACARSVILIFGLHADTPEVLDVPRLRHRDGAALGEVKKNDAGIGSSHAAEFDEHPAATEPGRDRRGGVCTFLPHPTPTAASLWSSNQADIFRSTQHPLDTKWAFHDFTAHLLHFMTADRLQRSIDSPPHDFDHVGRVLDVAYKRWKYVRDKTRGEMMGKPLQDDPAAPPRLNIVVMGGSVAMGVLCTSNPVTKENLGRYSRRSCAWPARLEAFLNTILKADVVRIDPITLGGTNTESGTVIWKYGLLPEGVPHPHVLINAYSTNDVHVNSVKAALARNETLHSSVWGLTQKFIRTVKSGCRGVTSEPPLLIILNDYVGNEQNEIIQTTLLSQAVHLLSTYYGTMAISYADAIRDLVYADTAEEWFSPHAWFQQGWYRQIHPGMGMHISATWVVAYNLLHLATTFCSLPSFDAQSGEDELRGKREAIEEDLKQGKQWNYGYRNINGLPELRDGKYVAHGPRPKPDGLPPELTDNLKLERVSQIWREQSKNMSSNIVPEAKCNSKPCIFSWVGGLEKNLNKPTALNDRMKPYLAVNEGWEADNDNNKLGFVPKEGKGSKFIMEFPKLTQPITIAVFMVIRSYGEKWEGSSIKADAFIQEGGQGKSQRLANKMHISGQHGKSTSETYNYEIDLTADGREGAVVGDSLKIAVELDGGTTFKITGMAVCHR